MMDIDDETLMALADGEITGDEAARLQALIAGDPALAARYALFTQTAQWVKQAALAEADSAVSADFEACIRDMVAAPAPESENVVLLRPKARQWQPMALAASLALAVGLSAGLVLAPGASAPDGPALTADLRDHLGTLPSGAQADLASGGRVTIVASFTDGNGAFCREYEVQRPNASAYVGVSCRADATWQLRFAMATSGETQGYTPAASLDALDAFYETIGASQPLAEEKERTLLK